LGLLADGRWSLATAQVHAAQWLFAPVGQALLVAGAAGSLALRSSAT